MNKFIKFNNRLIPAGIVALIELDLDPCGEDEVSIYLQIMPLDAGRCFAEHFKYDPEQIGAWDEALKLVQNRFDELLIMLNT